MKYKIWFSLCICFLVVSIIVAPIANGACDRMTYKESQDSKYHQFCRQGSLIQKDNNVWALSEAAQKRFAMPEEWQDEGLRGAEIAAFRLEPTGRQRCHGERADEKCVWSFECVLDLWIQNDIAIDIKGNHPLEYKPWKSSLYELGERNPDLKAKWERAFGLQGSRLLVEGEQASTNYSFEVIGYTKSLRKGMTMITMVMDGRASLLPIETKRSILFPLIGGDLHKVELPSSFWHRVTQLHEKTTEASELNWRGGREKSMNLWSYSKEFSEKYNMPPSAIRDNLVGAMAVAYRQEPEGVKSCGYGGDASGCTPGGLGRWSPVFDFYVTNDVDLALSTELEIASKIVGSSKSSTFFLREHNYKNDLPKPKKFGDVGKGGFPYKLIQFTYQVRNKSGKKDPKWYGSGSYGHAVIRGAAWNMDFTMASVSESMPQPYRGNRVEENFFLFVNSKKWIDWEDTLKNNSHNISLPPAYIDAVLQYDRLHKEKVGSFLDLVKKQYEK